MREDARTYFVVCRGPEPGDPVDWLAVGDKGVATFDEVVRHIEDRDLKVVFPVFFIPPEEMKNCLYLIVGERERMDDEFEVWVLMPFVPLPEMERLILLAIASVEDGWYEWQDNQAGLEF